MLTPLLAEIDGLINETLHEAGVDEEAVSLVIRTGGSSLIACVRDRLNHIFPGKVVEHDPFTSVAAGLAVASYHGLTY